MKQFHQAVGMDYDGARLGCAMEDPAGVLTFNVGTVNMDENGRILLQCNIRYPASVEYSDIRELLERQLKKYGFLYNEIDYLAPVYHKKDSSLIRCLMSAYQEVTGDMDTEPMRSEELLMQEHFQMLWHLDLCSHMRKNWHMRQMNF